MKYLKIISAGAVAFAALSLMIYSIHIPSKPCVKVFKEHDIITHKTLGKTVVGMVTSLEDDKNFCYISVPFPGVKQHWFSPQDFEEFSK